jgi:hypothetical protein
MAKPLAGPRVTGKQTQNVLDFVAYDMNGDKEHGVAIDKEASYAWNSTLQAC